MLFATGEGEGTNQCFIPVLGYTCSNGVHTEVAHVTDLVLLPPQYLPHK